MGMCYNPALVRDKPLGAPASVKLVYSGAGKGTCNNSDPDLRWHIASQEHEELNLPTNTVAATYSILAVFYES